MNLITILILAIGLGVDAFSVAIGIGAANNHGAKASKKASNGEYIKEEEALSPPHSGAVQLSNSAALQMTSRLLRFRNWGFTRKRSWAPVMRLAAAFGLFQFAMPLAGWLAGLTVVNVIGGYDHWIAFALLTYVGGKMILEGCKHESEEEKVDKTRGMPLLLLSVATSIDALAVGFSFSILKVPILFPAAIIGIICFLMTAIGMIFGNVLARIFGKKVEIFGGVVLIAIGVKILFDHLL